MANRRFFVRAKGEGCDTSGQAEESSFWDVVWDIFVAIFDWCITLFLVITLLSFLISMIGLLLAALSIAAWMSSLLSYLIFAGLFGWWMYEKTMATMIRIAVILDRVKPV